MLKKLVATAIVILVGLGAPATLYANGKRKWPEGFTKHHSFKPNPGQKPGKH